MSRNFQHQETFSFLKPKKCRLDCLRQGDIPEEFKGDLTVYLLHFSELMGSEKHAISHYIGVCKDLKRRLKQHRRGKNGSAITNELKKRKIKFYCVQEWENVNRSFERYLKSWRNHKQFCPNCQDVPFF